MGETGRVVAQLLASVREAAAVGVSLLDILPSPKGGDS